MHKDPPEKLLERFRLGEISMPEVLDRLRALPFEDLGFAKIDHHRTLRTGFPEVVFCQGKSTDQIRKIFRSLRKRNDVLLLTRASKEIFDALRVEEPKLRYDEPARCVFLEASARPKTGSVLIMTAGTADVPVAEEAALTASLCGAKVERIYDVGVAGIHRLLAHVDPIRTARCIVAVAGMEGALPSVVGGLASCPVIAVPTSIGYGSHQNGLTPLMTMLNSCAPNVVVVNVDNGFGAGFSAALVNNGPGGERQPSPYS